MRKLPAKARLWCWRVLAIDGCRRRNRDHLSSRTCGAAHDTCAQVAIFDKPLDVFLFEVVVGDVCVLIVVGVVLFSEYCAFFMCKKGGGWINTEAEGVVRIGM
jgi:hypothetical protein